MSSTTNHVDWSKWDSKEDQFEKYRHVKSELIYGSLPEKKPDVSIMIPTFRRADLLKEAIDSALAQKTKYSFNITVVDNDAEIDCETDKLLQQYCLKHDNILYYRNAENIGMFGNWNRCIELSIAEWFCMLHDDDMLMENYIEKMYSIAKKSTYGILGSYKTVLDERKDLSWNLSGSGKGKIISFFIEIFIKLRRGLAIQITNRDSEHTIFFFSTTFLANKLKAVSVGGYDDSFFPSSDAVFAEKAMKFYGAAFIPTSLYFYRIARNESLNEQTKWSVLFNLSSLMKAVQSSLCASSKKCERTFFESMIITYYSFPDIKNTILFSDLTQEYHIPAKYNRIWYRRYILIKYYLFWGLLLFRGSKKN